MNECDIMAQSCTFLAGMLILVVGLGLKVKFLGLGLGLELLALALNDLALE